MSEILIQRRGEAGTIARYPTLEPYITVARLRQLPAGFPDDMDDFLRELLDRHGHGEYVIRKRVIGRAGLVAIFKFRI